MASEVSMDKDMCKARQPITQISENANQKGIGNYDNCVLNALPVLEDIVSTEWECHGRAVQTCLPV